MSGEFGSGNGQQRRSGEGRRSGEDRRVGNPEVAISSTVGATPIAVVTPKMPFFRLFFNRRSGKDRRGGQDQRK